MTIKLSLKSCFAILKPILFLTVLICLMLSFTGCGKDEKPLIETGKYQGDIKEIDVYNVESENLFVCVDSSVGSEEEALNAHETIDGDLKLIRKVFGKDVSKPLVYAVRTEAGAYSHNDRVFCTVGEIESQEYREALVQTALQISEPWMIQGIAAYVFGSDIDTEALTAYYQSAENTDMLGLFAARFYTEWNSLEDVVIAQNTAASLTNFIIDRYGTEKLLEGVASEQKQEWLESIAVNRRYIYEYEGLFKGFKYTKSSEHPLIINSDDAVYRLLQVPTLETVEEVEIFLSRCINGRNSVMEYLKENAPENYEWIQSEAPMQINYRFSDSSSLIGSASGTSINLARAVPYLHEYIHLIVPPIKAYGWQYEGIADYLSWIVCSDSYYMDYLKWLVSEPNLDDMDLAFKELFYTLGGSADNLDARKNFDACVLFPKLYPEMSEFFTSFMTTTMSDRYGDNGNMLGTELTYAEAASLTSFLIDQYSLDIFLSYCREGDFEKAFSMKFEEAKDAWYTELMKRLE